MIRRALCAVLVAGCGAAAVRAPSATLAVRCADRAALVYVDEEPAGSAADLALHPLPLEAGLHRVELRAEGKLSAYREVRLSKGEHATLAVELRPDLDATPPPER